MRTLPDIFVSGYVDEKKITRLTFGRFVFTFECRPNKNFVNPKLTYLVQSMAILQKLTSYTL